MIMLLMIPSCLGEGSVLPVIGMIFAETHHNNIAYMPT